MKMKKLELKNPESEADKATVAIVVIKVMAFAIPPKIGIIWGSKFDFSLHNIRPEFVPEI